MKLMSIYEWRDNRFVGKRKPSDRTVRKWCEEGQIPCKKIGGLWFVEVESELRDSGNPLVDMVMNG